jgi:hypothetical protein
MLNHRPRGPLARIAFQTQRVSLLLVDKAASDNLAIYQSAIFVKRQLHLDLLKAALFPYEHFTTVVFPRFCFLTVLDAQIVGHVDLPYNDLSTATALDCDGIEPSSRWWKKHVCKSLEKTH